MTEEKNKRAKPVTMTARSKRLLEKQGHSVARVEQTIRFPEMKFGVPTGRMIPVTHDAFQFADLISVHPGINGTLYIQTTTVPNHTTRMHKIEAIPEAKTVLIAGNRIAVHGWKLCRKKGGKALWVCNIFYAYLDKQRNICFRSADEEESDGEDGTASETGRRQDHLFTETESTGF
jgi:hypothetical protein